ncbi:hypothetical protein I6A84_13055 [Frankia sp. CNm7]|uniref:Uncharacterized protein n=1 Tax=Frankia nepalensis TaxID=1836974 RepID=A0A937RKD5_9ACTN|nr:hypothetical protein [Frankia nepalensis]MBL7499651.1 hypothetical protein [Frankia nepalensis]MBL7514453.1 hypothetical protein [Frankia nepalensis]MBL7519008.1 hypothetical protein [Frankia nepalensis]MBL7628028.1 hypothetical protein [Frankia nepalensis]
MATLAGLLDGAVYRDTARQEPGSSAVVLIFDGGPVGSPAGGSWPGPVADGDAVAAAGGGWVPQTGAAAGPDRGITPYQLALWELLHAAPDGAAGARLLDAVRVLAPETVVVLADLVHDRRGGRCSGGS